MLPENIFITGSATGLGIALAECFLQQGYRVWGTYHTQRHPEFFVKKYEGMFIPVEMDIQDLDSIREVSKQIKNHLDRSDEPLTLIINNAAEFHPGPLLEAKIDDMLNICQVNIIGPILVIRYLRDLVYKNHREKKAQIINISTYRAKIPLPFTGLYGASKCALNMITDTLRLELIPFNITIVTILLGNVQTGALERQLKKMCRDETSEYFRHLNFRAEKGRKMAITYGCTSHFAANRIFKIAQKNNPKHTYTVSSKTIIYKILTVLSRWPIYLFIIRRYYFRDNQRSINNAE